MTSPPRGRVAATLVLAGLVVAAGLCRSRELGPPALWNDDAWVALISRHSWSDIWVTSLTSVGFRALIGAWIAVVGGAPVAAQALPFACGLLTIPATYRVSRLLGAGRLAAGFTAAVVAASPVLVTYSTRVKQYTADALLTLGMIVTVLWLLRAPERAGRWWVFTLAGVGAVVFSGQLLLVVGPAALIAVAAARPAWPRSWPAMAAAVGALFLAGLAWHWAVLAPVIAAGPGRYWEAYYLVADEGPRAAAQSLGLGLRRFVAGAVGPDRVHLAGTGALVLAALAWRPRLTLALLLPLLATLAAAAAGRAPIGARTDAFLVPLVAVAMATGLDALLRGERAGLPARLRTPVALGSLALAAAVVLVGAGARAVPAPYPRQDVRSLARLWRAERRADDRTFVSTGAARAFALYSGERVAAVRESTRQRNLMVDHPRISTLPRGARPEQAEPAVREGRRDRRARHVADRRTAAFYLEAIRSALDDRTDRVWLLAAHTGRGEVPLAEEALRQLGWTVRRHWPTDGDAWLTLYDRGRAAP